MKSMYTKERARRAAKEAQDLAADAYEWARDRRDRAARVGFSARTLLDDQAYVASLYKNARRVADLYP